MANTELRIKELCKERGITQAQLADKLGIQAVSFSQAVSRNKFNMDRLSDIADVLGVEIPDLFERPKKDSVSLTCPHCGRDINLKID
ncbi:helix-turn-helix transcriptional regulator [Parabacteroides sp. GYB001]|uniref:helix-turn-helix domain-containing protein n=1 Tax=Parabacteroides leei TaxID=2939491 RepID=UPI002016D39D|nr:helix-turn-helix transcriptional regulator [Parabacteroides leei]MCL3851443.1 helix-turn-helix transcriptional regulator [Parabacteroides leei]